ncbi:MAG: GNAT family N-acetyltransferase [Longimicrobiaceae bacterium]
MAETFRPGESADVDEAARIMTHSFPGATRGFDWWREGLTEGPHSGIESLWVGEEDGRIVAVCQLHPMRQWIGGREIPLMGLGSVAIAPTHRRRGLGKRLVAAGMAHARERGEMASALYPFRVGFYARLGYGLAGEALQYRFAPDVLVADPPKAGLHLVQGDDDFAELRKVYAAWARRQTGQLVRTERSWRGAWGGEDRAAVICRGADGEPEGYAIVRYRTDLPPGERFLEVEERAWLTDAAQRAIYGWLATLGDQWREIVYRAHAEEGFGDRLEEPRLPSGSAPGWGLWYASATLLRGPMFRLLDVAKALRMRSVAGDGELRLLLRVDDPQIAENRGPWLMELRDEEIRVEPHGGGTADAELEMGIGTLSRIYVGALTPTEAVTAGTARVDRQQVVERLDSAFAVPRPWTFDRF